MSKLFLGMFRFFLKLFLRVYIKEAFKRKCIEKEFLNAKNRMYYAGTTTEIDEELSGLRDLFKENTELIEKNKDFYNKYLRLPGCHFRERKLIDELYKDLNNIRLCGHWPKWLWRLVWKLL